MDERDKRRVGEQIEPGGRPKAPGRLELLQRFVNTWNHEFPAEWHRIGSRPTARARLERRRLVPAGTRVGAADVERLRRLREDLRTLAIANHGGGSRSAAAGAIGVRARPAVLRIEVDGRGRTSL